MLTTAVLRSAPIHKATHLTAVGLKQLVVLRVNAPHGIRHLACEAERRRHRLGVPAEDVSEIDVKQVAFRQKHEVVQMPVSDAQLRQTTTGKGRQGASQRLATCGPCGTESGM